LAGYSQTPLWKKLGYRDETTAYVEGAPTNYRAWLELPSDVGVQWWRRLRPGVELVHLFCGSKSALAKRLPLLRGKIDPAGAVWISWPKKSSGVASDLTEDVIRDVALPLGFVDIKVCAVSEIWSGLKVVIRKELRPHGSTGRTAVIRRRS
jgi:hypothetical protein